MHISLKLLVIVVIFTEHVLTIAFIPMIFLISLYITGNRGVVINVAVSSILFRKRAEILSWPELFSDARFFNYFLHTRSADIFKIKGRYKPLFKRVSLYQCYLQVMQQHWQKMLKVLDISVLSSMFSPFKVKNAGKSFWSMYLFKYLLWQTKYAVYSTYSDEIGRHNIVFLLAWYVFKGFIIRL